MGVRRERNTLLRRYCARSQYDAVIDLTRRLQQH
jgi:hypothetical protein